MKRRKKKKIEKGSPKWMVTYSDMVTLILVFFILLFSMSQIDLVKFDAISESFRNRMIFDFYPSPVPMEYPTEHPSNLESGNESNEFNTPTDNRNNTDKNNEATEKDTLNNLIEDVEQYLEDHQLQDAITANRTERGVVLVLPESILFNSGEAVILDSGKPFLQKVGSLLTEMPNSVKVEGHTDSRPISSYRYPSNWELSGARASSVIRYLVEEFHFSENRFSGAIYGETKPIVPNTPISWSQNRRVEIVILDNTPENQELVQSQ